jgi:hypothetical protein
VFLAKLRVEDITTVLLSLGTKGSLLAVRIDIYLVLLPELLAASESMPQMYCLFRFSKDWTMLGMYPFSLDRNFFVAAFCCRSARRGSDKSRQQESSM